MTDIVERLRAAPLQHWQEAAAELERLIERLRRADRQTASGIAIMDEAAAELERLRTQCGGNCRYWEGRWRDEAAELERLRGEFESYIAEAEAEAERLEAALERIEQWSRAYPLTVFPEPDLPKAAEVLKANGMTLDAISAHAMRHVVEGVGKIARDALQDEQKKGPGGGLYEPPGPRVLGE